MEQIIQYYIIIALSFVITSYIRTYRPAMKRSAQILVDLLEKNSTDYVLERIRKFLSWPYRILTFVVYVIAVFILFPIVAVGTMVNNKQLIDGFSDGILNGLLELNE
jgi:hypothetical protein